jgi:hypothetical protein
MRLQPITQPGYSTDVEFLASKKNLVPKAVTIDADLVRTGQYTADRKIIKSGTPIGKVTATGLYGPVRKTTLAANVGVGATSSVLVDARFFMTGETILINNESVTITSINYDTNTIGHAALAGAHNAGVTVREDNGLETADCILMNSLDVTDGDAAGAAVTQAVVREARIPAINSLIKADLTRVEFR